MKIRYLLAMICLSPLWAHAELYKAIDADGHVTYSSSPIKGSKKLNLEPLPTMVPLAKTRSPANFPRVDEETQKGRDDTRRKILLDELAAERKLLETAKGNLVDAESQNRGVFVTNGTAHVNEARAQEYQAEVAKQSGEVSMHQKNIDALNTELSKLQ